MRSRQEKILDGREKTSQPGPSCCPQDESCGRKISESCRRSDLLRSKSFDNLESESLSLATSCSLLDPARRLTGLRMRMARCFPPSFSATEGFRSTQALSRTIPPRSWQVFK